MYQPPPQPSTFGKTTGVLFTLIFWLLVFPCLLGFLCCMGQMVVGVASGK